MRWLLVMAVLSLAFPRFTFSQEAGLRVDAAQELGEISPYVYGANFGPLSAIPPDLIEAAQQSGITFLRYPGGRWGDLNDLQSYQIDAYIKVAEMIGAEPSIHVRLENGTPEAAAALVRYTNIENDYQVRYWYVGNEPNLFDNYTTEEYNVQWRAIAEAMLAVDPELILIGPEVSQYNGTPEVDPRDSEGRDWLREFLLANGDLVDVIAVHRYPFPRGNQRTTIEDLRANVTEWDHILPSMRRVIAETTGRDIPVAITEANSHWSAALGGEASPDSHYNAIWWADVLGRLIQHDPFIVGYFDLQSNNRRGGWGLMATYEVRPTYYVYQIYRQFGQKRVFAESGTEGVSVYAARRDDGALTLIVVNLTDSAQTLPLKIENFASAQASVWVFDAEHVVEPAAPLPFAEDMTLELTPQSISLYIFDMIQ